MAIKPKSSKPIHVMKPGPMNHKKAFGGGKSLPKFKNTRTVRGIRKSVSIIKQIKRDF